MTNSADLRAIRRKELSTVVIGVLRRHPSLNYYQGYHDVVSVLLSVMIPRGTQQGEGGNQVASEDALDAVTDVACRVSLHFLRDAMTENMMPTLGHLKVLRNILRYGDKVGLAKRVEQASPLPYFALPWLLSMFSHELDMPTACLVFDYLLPRGPSSLLYVSIALIERYKSKVDAPDAAEMHHVLSQLPSLITADNLPDILREADALAQSAPLTSADGKTSVSLGVMGRESVLYTWSSLPISPAKTTELDVDWSSADQKADAILQGDMSQIVLDALPSPPSSEMGDGGDDGMADGHIEKDKALVSRPWWPTSRRHKPVGKDGQHVVAGALLAWVGAVGAVSAALFILYGNSSTGGGVTGSASGLGSAFPLGLRAAEPLRALLRHALPR